MVLSNAEKEPLIEYEELKEEWDKNAEKRSKLLHEYDELTIRRKWIFDRMQVLSKELFGGL